MSSVSNTSTITSPEVNFSIGNLPTEKSKMPSVIESNQMTSPLECSEEFNSFDVEVSTLFDTEFDKKQYPDSTHEIEAIKKRLISEFEKSRNTSGKQKYTETKTTFKAEKNETKRVYSRTWPSYLKEGRSKGMLGLKEPTNLFYKDEKHEDDDYQSDLNFGKFLSYLIFTI